MAIREITPLLDHQLLVDVLNLDFGVVPSRRLRWFLGRYSLDTETTRQLRDELRGVLFLKDPKGRRELGELIAQANQYTTKTILVPKENNEDVETWAVDPEDPRQHLYGIVITAIQHDTAFQDDTFSELQESWRNCHRYYWRKGDFCSPECGQEFNRKDAKNRMR